MLTSLNPVGEAARGQRWTLTVTAYLAASIGGGAAVGGVLGGVGAPLVRAAGPAAAVALAVAALLGLPVDRSSRRLPSWRRQVDERWLGSYRGWVYGGGFGLTRALPVLATRRVTDAAALRHLHRRVIAWQPGVTRLTGVAQVAAAAALMIGVVA
jgi:hypothetical protein